MEDFFNTIYYWTNSLYCEELDNYLYDTVPGYLHVGLSMLVMSLIVCWLFYYRGERSFLQPFGKIIYGLFRIFHRESFSVFFRLYPLKTGVFQIFCRKKQDFFRHKVGKMLGRFFGKTVV